MFFRMNLLALVAVVLASQGALAFKNPSSGFGGDPNLSKHSDFRMSLVKGGKLCNKMMGELTNNHESLDLASTTTAHEVRRNQKKRVD
ncbi:MAG: hypothetical protein NDI61_09620 [Bdellovibrionaceae bacterium]|nr:hypothetical protein [Pseudobdellovibrionaceae bacterium]